jgi:hypothetical protein
VTEATKASTTRKTLGERAKWVIIHVNTQSFAYGSTPAMRWSHGAFAHNMPTIAKRQRAIGNAMTGSRQRPSASLKSKVKRKTMHHRAMSNPVAVVDQGNATSVLAAIQSSVTLARASRSGWPPRIERERRVSSDPGVAT